MEKQILINYIEEGLTVKEIANKLEVGMNSAKYWLKFYHLNTAHKEVKYECQVCGKPPSINFTPFCSKECSNIQYSSNANNYLKQKERSWVRKYQLILEKGGCCQKCGYAKNIAALEFHHLDPENKSFTLDARRIGNSKWELIQQEAKKCLLICSNCHAEEHSPDSEICKVKEFAENRLDNYNENLQKIQPSKGKGKIKQKGGEVPERKGNWPSDEELKELVLKFPITQLAKQIGVSSTFLKKTCDDLNIQTPTKGTWKRQSKK